MTFLQVVMHKRFSSSSALVILLYTTIALLFIYASFNIARLVVPSLSKGALNLVIALSLSSYAAYLFHRPFYLIFAGGVANITHVTHFTEVTRISSLSGAAAFVPILFRHPVCRKQLGCLDEGERAGFSAWN